jgi:hypothetical protein
LVACENIGNVVFNYSPCQPFGYRSFAYSRLTDQEGIILPPPAKRLYQALQFLFTPN